MFYGTKKFVYDLFVQPSSIAQRFSSDAHVLIVGAFGVDMDQHGHSECNHIHSKL